MIYQIDRSNAGNLSGVVTYHSPRDSALLAISCALVAFGMFCWFEGEPRWTAKVVGYVSMGIGAVAFLFGGLATRVVFQSANHRMCVSWTLFGVDLLDHSHPYSAIALMTKQFVYGSKTLGLGCTCYVAAVGKSQYLLRHSDDVPVTDAYLKILRKQLGFKGFEGEPNHLLDPTSPSVTPPAGAGVAPSVTADH